MTRHWQRSSLVQGLAPALTVALAASLTFSSDAAAEQTPTPTHRSRLTSNIITAQVEYDFFEVMEENGYHYGYWDMASELPAAAVGLWNFIEDYVNTHLRHEWARWKPCITLRSSPQSSVAGSLKPDLKVRGTVCLTLGPLNIVLTFLKSSDLLFRSIDALSPPARTQGLVEQMVSPHPFPIYKLVGLPAVISWGQGPCVWAGYWIFGRPSRWSSNN